MSTSVEYEILLKNGQFTKAAKESERAIRDVGGAVEQTGEKHVSLRAQLREVREELVAMEQAGKRGTQAYSDLQNKAARLTDALSDANAQARILAHDQRGMQGVLSGLTGLSGAFSAAAGAAGLLGAEEDKLQAVMARIQNLMGITVGLQQLQQTLDKDSAFRLVVLNGLKKWWVKVQTEAAVADAAEAEAVGAGATAHTAHTAAAVADTAATTAAATAATAGAGAFRLLGAAIKSIPVIGWVLAVISAAAAGVAAVVRRHKRAQKEMEEQAEAVAEKSREAARAIREATGQAAADGVTDIERLAAAYSKLGNNLQDKQRFVADNAEAFRKLGVEVRGVADAENLLIRNKDKFVQAQIAKATAQAYAEKAKELIKSNIALMGVDTSPRPQGPLGTGEMFNSLTDGIMVKQARILRQTLQNLWEEAAKETAKAASLMSDFTPATGNTGNGGQHQDDAAKEELIGWVAKYWKLVDERDKAIEKIKSHLGETIHFDAGDVTYDSNAIDQEVEKVRAEFEKDVLKLAEEYGELYVPVDVKPETDNEAYEQLLDEYADYRRKLANIKKKYDEQLKDAGNDESLKELINTRRQQEIDNLTVEAVRLSGSLGSLLTNVDSLGNVTRNLLLKRLQELVDFVKAHKGDLSSATDDSASRFGIDADVLKNLLQSDDALNALLDTLGKIERNGAIGKLTDAIKKYKAAKESAKGSIVDEQAVAEAQDAILSSMSGIKDAALGEIRSVGEALKEIGEYLDINWMKDAGDAIDDILGNIQAAESGAQAWGGWWGAIIGGLTDAIPKIVKWASGTRDLDREINKLDKTLQRITYDLSMIDRYTRNGTSIDQFREKWSLLAAAAEEARAKMNQALWKDGGNQQGEEFQQALYEYRDYLEQLSEYLEEYYGYLSGSSVSGLFDDLSDMIWDAFGSGKDAMDDFEQYFSEMLLNMIKKQVLWEVMGDKIERYVQDLSYHFAEGHLTGEDAMGWINWLQDYGMGIAQEGRDALEALRPIFEGLSVAVDDAGTLSGSIKGITSEQAGMLAGQMNAMRTAQLQQVSLLTEQLDALNNIGNNTRYIREIYHYIRSGNAGNNLNRAYGQS